MTGLCVGCLRTLDKVRGRKQMAAHKRHQVINDRPGRLRPRNRASGMQLM
ncbi:DUF1289 domain-containing protein [Paraburkholderia phenazinium]|nr:DUF1289 domain-containing protein [Paraburkholderia phenazinium]